MSTISKRTASPFRFDTVGSYLRPQKLKDARAQFAAGKISQQDLTKVEDRCIIELIKKEEQAGVQAVTDGEFRRSWWHLDFIWGFNGIERAECNEGYRFHDEITRAETVKVVGENQWKKSSICQSFQIC